MQHANIAHYVSDMAARAPRQPAVVTVAGRAATGRPHYATWSFAELDSRTRAIAAGLSGAGLEKGTRTLVMIRPGFEFIGVVFALLRLGAVPLLIDPGMGLRGMLRCIRQVAPQAFIGSPLAHAVRVANPGAFDQVRLAVTVGRRWGWRGPTLRELSRASCADRATADSAASDPAAVLFTSGSTGPAKGVVYEHGMFAAQLEALKSTYGFEPGESKLATFPLFALFCPGLGLTCIIPDMDASRPARADPARILQAIRDQRPSSAFGSPALWRNLLDHCRRRRATLPGLRRLLVAGAPVPGMLVEGLRALLDSDGEVYTPYGATEALPVCSISGTELSDGCIEASRHGRGICVGSAVAGLTVRVIAASSAALDTWSEDLRLPPGQIGEIVVRGAVVTRSYHGLPQATAMAKIEAEGGLWHRMGDVGYFDDRGRLWYCGRKAHRVDTADGILYTIPCEAPFNEHPQVSRCALVGVEGHGGKDPVIVVEPHGPLSRRGRRRLAAELQALAATSEVTRAIQTFAFRGALPVDRRHNAKIDRENLAAWAGRRLARGGRP